MKVQSEFRVQEPAAIEHPESAEWIAPSWGAPLPDVVPEPIRDLHADLLPDRFGADAPQPDGVQASARDFGPGTTRPLSGGWLADAKGGKPAELPIVFEDVRQV